jgi:DNA-binding response OmpR family regulator
MNSILIVDDEAEVRRLYRELLSNQHFRIDEATNGREALEKAGKNLYDVYISDIYMPKMDGFAFINELKQIKPDAVVIIVSGFDDIANNTRAIACGAWRYLVKPVKRHEFLAVIEQGLRIQGKLQFPVNLDAPAAPKAVAPPQAFPEAPLPDRVEESAQRLIPVDFDTDRNRMTAPTPIEEFLAAELEETEERSAPAARKVEPRPKPTVRRKYGVRLQPGPIVREAAEDPRFLPGPSVQEQTVSEEDRRHRAEAVLREVRSLKEAKEADRQAQIRRMREESAQRALEEAIRTRKETMREEWVGRRLNDLTEEKRQDMFDRMRAQRIDEKRDELVRERVEALRHERHREMEAEAERRKAEEEQRQREEAERLEKTGGRIQIDESTRKKYKEKKQQLEEAIRRKREEKMVPLLRELERTALEGKAGRIREAAVEKIRLQRREAFANACEERRHTLQAELVQQAVRARRDEIVHDMRNDTLAKRKEEMKTYTEGFRQKLRAYLALHKLEPAEVRDRWFDEQTFDTLEGVSQRPDLEYYLMHKSEVRKHLETPFMRLYRTVAESLPPKISALVETASETYSSFIKDDLSTAVWDFLGGFYFTKNGRGIPDTKLYIAIDRNCLEFGFYIVEPGSEQRDRFKRNCEDHGGLIRNLLDDGLKDDHLIFSDWTRNFFRPDLDTGAVSILNQWVGVENDPIYVAVRIPRAEALSLPSELLQLYIVETFKELFPLVLFAADRDPLANLAFYLDLNVAAWQSARDVLEEYTTRRKSERSAQEAEIDRQLAQLEARDEQIFSHIPKDPDLPPGEEAAIAARIPLPNLDEKAEETVWASMGGPDPTPAQIQEVESAIDIHSLMTPEEIEHLRDGLEEPQLTVEEYQELLSTIYERPDRKKTERTPEVEITPEEIAKIREELHPELTEDEEQDLLLESSIAASSQSERDAIESEAPGEFVLTPDELAELKIRQEEGVESMFEGLGPVTLDVSEASAAAIALRERLELDEQDLPALLDAIRDEFSLQEQILRRIADSLKPEVAAEGTDGDELADFHRRLEEAVRATGYPAETLKTWLREISRRGQGLLVGAPGMGRTVLAEHLAGLLMNSDGLFEIAQFHPAFTYHRFIGGNDPSGALQEGLFPAFCRQASHRRGTSVMLIDEIGLANVGEVFGELRYALDQRGKKIRLAADGSLFTIPANVVVIGVCTHAEATPFLRSLFQVVTLTPTPAHLRNRLEVFGSRGGELAYILTGINELIPDPDHRLGPVVFLREGERLAERFADLWTQVIEPAILPELPAAQREAHTWNSLRRGALKSWDIAPESASPEPVEAARRRTRRTKE